MQLNWKNPYAEEIAALVPMVLQKVPGGERSFDIFSLMLNQRIIFMHEDVHDGMSSVICASLLYLESENPKADISLYINSPGGVVTAGLAIYDTMNLIGPDVATTCMGQAASMGAFLLSAGAKGKRMALPSARIMIHQPLGGAQGQATDIQIQAQEILRLKQFLTQAMADHSGRTYEEMYDACERDNFMSAQQALEFGLIDKIVKKNEVQ
jgi:ATP-dependent Clp protease protease subunit